MSELLALLDRLDAEVQAATARPWRPGEATREPRALLVGNGPFDLLLTVSPSGAPVLASEADARAIALLRNVAPELIAHVRFIKAQLGPSCDLLSVPGYIESENALVRKLQEAVGS